jgi:predicted RNA methylase
MYFEAYGKPGIHQEMMNDQRRVDAYREAISRSLKNKVVADVGAGTGVLSIMAAEAGA